MLTDKQIADMRKTVNQQWVPQLLVILAIFMLVMAAARLYMVDVLCRKTGITWSQVWRVALSGPDMSTIYVGAELKAQELLHGAGLSLILAMMMATYAFTAARQRAKDLLLLEYIDKEKPTS